MIVEPQPEKECKDFSLLQPAAVTLYGLSEEEHEQDLSRRMTISSSNSITASEDCAGDSSRTMLSGRSPFLFAPNCLSLVDAIGQPIG